MVLPSPSLALWEDPGYSVYYWALAHNPATVFTARVDEPRGVTYPANDVHYDGAVGVYTDLKPEMLLLLGTSAGADDLGRQRIHLNDVDIVATANQINIGRTSQGTRDGELDIQDDAYITVLDLRPVWAATPWIDADTDSDNPVTYKDGVLTFDATTCFRPVVNLGVDRLRIVDTPSDTVDMIFSVTAYRTHPDATGTPTVLWDIADGTLIAGTLTSTTITVRYGVTTHHRYIACTATDSLGNTQQGWRLVAVADKNHADLITKFTIARWKQGMDGQDWQIKVDSPLAYGTYPDGTEILVAQRERYNFATVGSLTGYTDAENMVFAGWLQSEQNTGDAGKRGFIGRTTLTLADGAMRLKTLPGFPQTVARESVPTHWEEMQAANIDRYIYYLLAHHSNTLTRVDFTWSGTGETYAFPTLGSDGASLYDQADKRCQAIAFRLTCNKNGQLAMLADPLLQPTTAQAAEFDLPTVRTSTVVLPISEADWMNYSYTYTRPPRVHWNRGECIAVSTEDAADLADIGTFFAVAPGLAPGQGVSGQVSGQQLAVSQGELNVREGNRYAARMNAREGYFEVEIRPGDVIDPAHMTWVQFSITSATAGPRGRTYLSERFLPIELNHSYSPRKGLRVTKITLEREVSGIPAVLDPQPTVPVTTYPPVTPEPPTTVPPPGFDPALNKNTIFALNTDGYLYYCGPTLTGGGFSIPSSAGGPVWLRVLIALVASEGAASWSFDAFCPAGLGTGTEVRGWLATYYALYRVTHAENPATITFTQCLTMTGSPFTFVAPGLTERSLASERGTPNRLVCVSNAGIDTTWMTTSVDGVHWADEINIDAAGGSGTSRYPAAYVSPRSNLMIASSHANLHQSTAATPSFGAAISGLTFATGGATTGFHTAGIHVPFNQPTDNLFYIAGIVGSTPKLYRGSLTSATLTDITPTIAATPYTGFTQYSLQTSPANRLIGCAAVWSSFGSTGGFGGNFAIVRTLDGGDSWSVMQAAAAATGLYEYAQNQVTDNNTSYHYGYNNIGLCENLSGAAVIDTRMGDIPANHGTAGQFVAIWGG